MLYKEEKGVNVAAHPPKGEPAEAEGLSTSNMPLILNTPSDTYTYINWPYIKSCPWWNRWVNAYIEYPRAYTGWPKKKKKNRTHIFLTEIHKFISSLFFFSRYEVDSVHEKLGPLYTPTCPGLPRKTHFVRKPILHRQKKKNPSVAFWVQVCILLEQLPSQVYRDRTIDSWLLEKK